MDLLNVYFLIHGVFITLGVLTLPEALRNYEQKATNRPYYMKIQPLLRCLGFLLGPVGVFLYFIGDLLVPEKWKIWLQ